MTECVGGSWPNISIAAARHPDGNRPAAAGARRLPDYCHTAHLESQTRKRVGLLSQHRTGNRPRNRTPSAFIYYRNRPPLVCLGARESQPAQPQPRSNAAAAGTASGWLLGSSTTQQAGGRSGGDVLLRRRGVPAARVAPGPALRGARRPRLLRRRHHLDHRAAHLVHLPLLPLRDGAAGGGRGARQGAAPCHDLVHLQDTLLMLSADDLHFIPVPVAAPDHTSSCFSRRDCCTFVPIRLVVG